MAGGMRAPNSLTNALTLFLAAASSMQDATPYSSTSWQSGLWLLNVK
uniref:Trichloroethylene degradading protein Tce2 n=1 Tax=Bacillus cereus TaxID=1396 RepID=J7GXX2_BACCE|nr:trichloroethylene degradading protein Tce2 [Bacillus cereus]